MLKRLLLAGVMLLPIGAQAQNNMRQILLERLTQIVAYETTCKAKLSTEAGATAVTSTFVGADYSQQEQIDAGFNLARKFGSISKLCSALQQDSELQKAIVQMNDMGQMLAQKK